MRAVVAFLVAVNPPVVAAALAGRIGRRALAAALIAAVGAVALTAAASGPLLDLLDVTAPTFRVATGVVLGVTALRWLVVGTAAPEDSSPEDSRPEHTPPVPLLVLLLLTPQLVAVSIMVGADDGVAAAAAAGAVALVATGLAASGRQPRPLVWGLAARLVGMVGVAVALALVVDGVKSV